jgi:hypothetical protein
MSASWARPGREYVPKGRLEAKSFSARRTAKAVLLLEVIADQNQSTQIKEAGNRVKEENIRRVLGREESLSARQKREKARDGQKESPNE